MEEEFTSDDEDSRPVSESPRDIDYERRPRNGSLSQNNIAMRPPDSGRKRSASDTSVTEPPKKRKKRENLKIDFESKTTSKQAVFYRTPVEINPKFATFLGRDKISKGDGMFANIFDFNNLAYKRIWEYIKEKGLQKDPADKTRIFCDDTLRDLLEPEEDVIPNIWTLNNLVKQLLNNEERLPKPKVGVPASPSSISPPPPAMTPTWNGGLVQSPMLPTPPIKTSPQTMIQSGIPSPLKQPTTPTGMYKSPQAMPPGVPVRPSPTVPKPPQQPTWPNASTSSLMNFSAVLPNLQPPQFLMSPQQHPQQLTKVQLQRLIEQQKQPQQTQQRSSFPHLTSPTHFEPK
jgi:chromatin remodeling complex protein RSC6